MTINDQGSLPGKLLDLEHVCWSPVGTSDNFTIFEDTYPVAPRFDL
jgi:hypothetical protein